VPTHCINATEHVPVYGVYAFTCTCTCIWYVHLPEHAHAYNMYMHMYIRDHHDHMVVGFTTTCAISTNKSCEFEPRKCLNFYWK
jgi:hypothetical protein